MRKEAGKVRSDKTGMQVGMSTACFFGREVVEDAVQRMGGRGVRFVEVFLNTFSEYAPAYVHELKQRLDGLGMTVLSVHPQGVQFEPQMFSPYERARKDATQICRQLLEAGRILGAARYVYHGGMDFKPARRGMTDMDLVAERTEIMCGLAQEYGLQLAYENVHWCWFRRPEFARDLLARTQHPALCFTLDVKQAAQSGYDPLDYLAAMGDRLRNVHLCDFVREGEGFVRPVMPFCGQMDFAALRGALCADGYAGELMLEVYATSYADEDELFTCFEQVNSYFG